MPLINEVINTPHGKATILGFERFDKKGNKAPMSLGYRGDERIICKLAEGHTWAFESNYGLYSHEYRKLNL